MVGHYNVYVLVPAIVLVALDIVVDCCNDNRALFCLRCRLLWRLSKDLDSDCRSSAVMVVLCLMVVCCDMDYCNIVIVDVVMVAYMVMVVVVVHNVVVVRYDNCMVAVDMETVVVGAYNVMVDYGMCVVVVDGLVTDVGMVPLDVVKVVCCNVGICNRRVVACNHHVVSVVVGNVRSQLDSCYRGLVCCVVLMLAIDVCCVLPLVIVLPLCVCLPTDSLIP